MKFRVVIAQDEDGVFIAQCPALPGCVSQGKTRKEAEANVKEAIQGYIESLRNHDEPIPPPITEEIIDIAI
jgi:antitoxin HicB